MHHREERRRPTRSQIGYCLLAGYILLYLSWQAFRWLPLEQSLAGDILGMPLTLLAVYAAWRASRRASRFRRLRRAWLWVALALAGQAAGGIAQLLYEYTATEPSYPSISDPLYLSFYPLLLVGILSFPAMRRSRHQALELVLDCAIVALGGGAAFAYFVLGPETVSGSTPLEAAVTIAYPVGDLILLVALAAAVMRNPLPDVRTSLSWMAAAMGLFVVGDLIFGYVVLHGGYEGGDLVDTSYLLAFACFIVAATRQRHVGEPKAFAPRVSEARVSWLPYVAIAASLTILIAEEYGHPFFPDLAVTSIAVAVTTLVVMRQVMSLASARQGRARLAEAQKLSHLGSWEWEIERDRVELSEEEARLFGIDSTTTMTRSQSMQVVHPGDRETVNQIVGASLKSGKPFTFEVRIVRPDGETRTLLSRGEVETHNGRVVRLHGTHQDITDRKQMEDQLQFQADHDPLTGLFNRRRFSEELDRSLRYAARYNRSGAVLMLDIDNFKFANDANGHAFGDATLKLVSRAIASRAHETDIVARLGGDEFAIVLPEVDEREATEVAEDIRLAVSGNGAPEPTHLSVGIAPFDGGRELVADDVLIAADIALYEAKQAGRDQVRVDSGEKSSAMTWVEGVRAALAEGRFVLYAQPMVDLKSGQVSHKELLVRMLSEDGDAIPPDAFLPTAERFGLINEIDRWVTAEGLMLARQGERVSINLSAPSIGDTEILATIREAIDAGVEPGDLIFEITETAAMTDMEAARDFAAALGELGCSVALDDFGTGFGSFAYLKHLPTSYLKIDMDFVRDMLTNPTDRQLVRSITEVAHSLGKKTIAEGVEDEATLRALRAYGIDFAQGFFIGRPERISPPTRFERRARVGHR